MLLFLPTNYGVQKRAGRDGICSIEIVDLHGVVGSAPSVCRMVVAAWIVETYSRDNGRSNDKVSEWWRWDDATHDGCGQGHGGRQDEVRWTEGEA